jgi:hypothetical protein
MLLNSADGIRYAEALADRLRSEYDDNASRITRLFELALARSPSDDERSQCNNFLTRHVTLHHDAESPEQSANRAWIDLCRAILNLNEFLYID